MRIFRDLSNHVCRGPYFRKYISYEGHYFWKCSKFDVDLKNAQKNWEKVFCFSDKCIGIVCIELFLLRREYLSSAGNVLTKSLRLCMSLRVTFLNSITFTVINEYGKDAGVGIDSVFWPVYRVACWGVISNRTF